MPVLGSALPCQGTCGDLDARQLLREMASIYTFTRTYTYTNTCTYGEYLYIYVYVYVYV